MPMRRREMGNPDAISILLHLLKCVGRTFLRFVAVEVAVVDDTSGFTYRDCCHTDNRLQWVRRAAYYIRV
jgi:hypothetical protein